MQSFVGRVHGCAEQPAGQSAPLLQANAGIVAAARLTTDEAREVSDTARPVSTAVTTVAGYRV